VLVNTVTAGEIRTFAQLEIPPDESEVQIDRGDNRIATRLKTFALQTSATPARLSPQIRYPRHPINPRPKRVANN